MALLEGVSLKVALSVEGLLLFLEFLLFCIGGVQDVSSGHQVSVSLDANLPHHDRLLSFCNHKPSPSITYLGHDVLLQQ